MRLDGKLGLVAAFAAVGCARVPFQKADAMSAEAREELGEDRLSFKWKFVTADRLTEVTPQEFASPAVYADTLYVGSARGWFYALRSTDARVRWRKLLGSVVCAPLVDRGMLYVGTNDGFLVALDAQTGQEKWRYQARGPIGQTPAASRDLIVFANEADQVVAVDAITGKFKWQYKAETPEEYTLRGHAGVAIDGDLIYSGFSNGSLVALRRDTGSLAWSTSLKGDADRFMDVDATPLIIEGTVYASSSSGGVYAIDKTTGLVKWRVPFWDASQPSSTGNVGGITSDGKAIYVSVADLGTYAIDLTGNVLWRVGARGGGEPAEPVVHGDLLVYSLAGAGLFIAERKTGNTLEYFDPGDGISAQPTITLDGRLFVMSNRGILYAFDLDD
ncbi:MAG TPA: PQQ-binding-like beta-propeller repeat protein [Kofleriaceae bacterium]|nr:PQQ-binding-like beta-propeller repeat protein [Kofleriaceae bacterium]